jgi:hypothetical protein
VEESDPSVNDRVDTAYRDKYCSYGERFVNPVVGPEARAATIKLVPGSLTT